MKKIDYKVILKSYGTVIAGILITMVFAILRPNSFATVGNFINISRQISLLVVIAIGATLIMSLEEFDLSVGAMASLGGVLAARMAVDGTPLIFAFIVPIFVGLLIGFVNGWIVTKFKVLSFIITLAMSTILAGFTFWFTGGSTVFENIPKNFKYIGTANIVGLPLLTIIMVLLTVIFWFIMSHTSFGRKLYAIGGNEVASEVSGIKVKKYKILTFGLCSALAAFTGVLMSSRLGSAHPTGGDGLFLQAYAAVFIGRTIFSEGVPNIWGTFAGAAILGILANGLTILQVPTFMQDLITGFIIIAAVIFQKLGSDKN